MHHGDTKRQACSEILFHTSARTIAATWVGGPTPRPNMPTPSFCVSWKSMCQSSHISNSAVLQGMAMLKSWTHSGKAVCACVSCPVFGAST
jgi:hypothetical protein